MCEKLQIITRHKIRPRKISAGKCVTQSWILGVRLKKSQHTNETKKKEFPSIIDSKGG